MNKAEAYLYWWSTVFKRGSRYYMVENGRTVRAMSWAQFWKIVQLQARLAASDRGGNITL